MCPIKPMEPIATSCLIDDPNWIYQLKWDGVRILTEITASEIRLYTRKGNDRTNTYPEISEELQKLFLNQSVILDGEMVALKDNKPNFFKLISRDRLKSHRRINSIIQEIPVYYIIFDILYFKGCWLTNQPLSYRLEILETIKSKITSPLIQICPSTSNGEFLYTYTKTHGWEGIVMKEKKGMYYLGRQHPTWRKLKNYQLLDATVIGLEFQSHKIKSLLLAIEQKGVWKYIGKVASGLSQKDVNLLLQFKDKLEITKPVLELPTYSQKPILWVRPILKITVKFMEYTPEGILRAPVIVGFKKNP